MNIGTGKEHIKTLEKEVELLKQQLQGKIKTGQTFIGNNREPVRQERARIKEVAKDKEQSGEGPVKKKKPSRVTTINLLDELQKANNSNSSTYDISNNSNSSTCDSRCVKDTRDKRGSLLTEMVTKVEGEENSAPLKTEERVSLGNENYDKKLLHDQLPAAAESAVCKEGKENIESNDSSLSEGSLPYKEKETSNVKVKEVLS